MSPSLLSTAPPGPTARHQLVGGGGETRRKAGPWHCGGPEVPAPHHLHLGESPVPTLALADVANQNTGWPGTFEK